MKACQWTCTLVLQHEPFIGLANFKCPPIITIIGLMTMHKLINGLVTIIIKCLLYLVLKYIILPFLDS